MSRNKKKSASESLKVKLKVDKKIYLKPVSEDWGIYGTTPIEFEANSIKTNRWNSITIKGNIPAPLRMGKIYTVYLNPDFEYNGQYDSYTYEVTSFEVEQLTLPEEQFEFLATITTEAIAEQLEIKYKDRPIIDLILNDEVDYTNIKGLKEKTFEKLKEKANEYRDLGHLNNMLKPLGVKIGQIKKIANHFGSAESAHHILKKSMYNLCQVKGYGFVKVDEIALKSGVEPEDRHRITQCFAYIIDEDANNGNSWSYREDIRVQAIEILKVDPQIVDDYLDSCTYEKGKTYNFTDTIVINELVSTFGMYWDERNILNQLDRLVEQYDPSDFDNVEEIIDRTQLELGIVYTDEQREAIKEALTTGVYILEGAAGTGKSTVIKAILSILEHQGRQTIGVCLSGKAANVLHTKGVNAATIHRALGYDGNGFAFDEDEPFSFKGVNHDEAGMTNANLWSSLLSAIPDGGTIIITGDSGQLPAIGAGDVLRDLLASDRYKKRKLLQIHRQAAKSGVITVAHRVRNGENITSRGNQMNEIYGELQDLQVMTMFKPKKDDVFLSDIMSEEQQKEELNPIYKQAKEYLHHRIQQIKFSGIPEQGIMDFQVICPIKSGSLGVESINNYMQMAYNGTEQNIYQKGSKTFKKSDKILVNGNKYKNRGYASVKDFEENNPIKTETQQHYEDMMFDEPGEEQYKPYDVFNGTLGIIQKVYPDKKTILAKFEGVEALIAFSGEDVDSIDLGYAITVHKSQGSSIPYVLFLFDYSAFKLLTRQLVYTAITRTSNGGCIVMCQNDALNHALNTDGSVYRRTFLSLLLQALEGEE